MRLVAIVPVKKTSDRVASKNFRPFHDGLSLFELKIKQLNAAGVFDKIYVSTDHDSLIDEQERLGFTYLARDKAYCNNVMPWSDVIAEVAGSLPEDQDTHVAWCHTTSPLFDDYQVCVDKYKELLKIGDHDGLVSVKRVLEFLVSEAGLPMNYAWGPWHRYSQHLPTVYAVNGALFISTKKIMAQNRYVISPRPYLMEADDRSSIDVDTQEDFEYAQFLIQRENK